jgi:hypothetical protein
VSVYRPASYYEWAMQPDTCPAHGPLDDGTCHGCTAEDRAEHQEREGRR